MDRDAFLDRVRDHLATAPQVPAAHPIPEGTGVPDVLWPEDGRPVIERFVDAVAVHGGAARVVGSADDLHELLTEIVDTHGTRTAVTTAEPVAEETGDALRALGVTVGRFDDVGSADVELGITGAVAAIARTGTVVIDGSRGRSPSLLPDVHFALVERGDLVDTPSDVWRRLPDRFDGDLPSQVVLVTGPSKTADVEGVLTVGVHGPRAVWVGILDR